MLKGSETRVREDAGAHQEAVEPVGETGGAQESEIDDDRSSVCRARRPQLGAFQLDSFDVVS
jgi:hypothetical protein